METILIAAMTADGYIGRHSTDKSTTWTSPEDKQFYVSQIKTVDAIVMGSVSFGTFNRYPKDSNWVIYDYHPEEFENPAPDRITAKATKAQPEDLIAEFEAAGFERVAICGGKSIYSMFHAAGLIDRYFITVEPVLFGDGVRLFDKAAETRLNLEQIHRLSEQTVVMEYSKIINNIKNFKIQKQLYC